MAGLIGVRKGAAGVVAMAGVALLTQVEALPARGAVEAPVFGPAVKLAGSDGGTEPRATVGPLDHRWVISNVSGTATVWGSTDGVSWAKTATNMPDQSISSIDVDTVATATGRIIASELDFKGPAIITAYSDDLGKTWTRSGEFLLGGLVNGTELIDQDRQWFAVGPVDPATHQQRVYMLFHNLLSGAASHNMYVMTSTDSGATFGPPIPVTLPGSQAWLDLQCADSGGPSNIMVNQKTGQVYAVFGVRSSIAGGCGASVTGAFEINIVAATRVWVATAAAADTANPTGWSQSMAVDDSAAGRIVGMQLSYGALDTAGNVYVAYPESPNPYPDYSGATVRYVHSDATMATWSKPVTVAAGGNHHNLVHMLAGDPGQLDFAYYTGIPQKSGAPLWYATVAQTLDGLAATPAFSEVRLSSIPAYHWDPSAMMGACGSGPTQGVQNGFACSRSTDVWGVALDSKCNLLVTWPVEGNGPGATPNTKDAGTYVADQVGGPTLCGAAEVVPTTTPPAVLPKTAGAPAPMGLGAALLILAVAFDLGRRRRAGASRQN